MVGSTDSVCRQQLILITETKEWVIPAPLVTPVYPKTVNLARESCNWPRTFTVQANCVICELIDHVRGNVRFVFADPSNAGPDLELSFENNNAAINAKSLFASQTFLRQQMSRTIENGDTTSELARARR